MNTLYRMIIPLLVSLSFGKENGNCCYLLTSVDGVPPHNLQAEYLGFVKKLRGLLAQYIKTDEARLKNFKRMMDRKFKKQIQWID